MSDQAEQTPLVDLLRNIPCDFRAQWPIHRDEDGNPTGHALSPVGRLAHEAADRILELEAQLVGQEVSVPEWMSKISSNIKTQNNHITADPLFVVFQKQGVVVDENYDYNRITWVNDEGNEAGPDTLDELDGMREGIESRCFMANNIALGGYEQEEWWQRLAIKDVDEFVTACFTESGAKDYLKRNGHNLNKPFIFVTSLHRNEEMKELRNWLAEITRACEPKEQGQ